LALGEVQLTRSAVESDLYDNLTKAGEFVDSEGNVRQAGLEEEGADNFSL
jgi:hypothetical protein